jgi:hypothetical protein
MGSRSRSKLGRQNADPWLPLRQNCPAHPAHPCTTVRVESGRAAVIRDRLLYGERDTGCRTYGGLTQSRFRVAAGTSTRLRGRLKKWVVV